MSFFDRHNARPTKPRPQQSTEPVDVTAREREHGVIDHGVYPSDRPLDPDLTGYGAVVDHIRQHHLRSAEMTPTRAAEILAAHNAWRRDEAGHLPYTGNATELGQVIDVVVAFVRQHAGAPA